MGNPENASPRITRPLPSILMAHPTVFDVLRDRIERDEKIKPQDRAAIYLKSCQIICERRLTQI